jgi:penicillin V acylase-like amidase (Ntn superfamily)
MALLVKKTLVNVAIGAALFTSAISAVQACSRLIWDTENFGVFVSRTMDWMVETHPTLDVRAKGISYRGAESGDKVMTWTSKYASILTTFYGKAGIDGFNEMGLAVNALYLNEESSGKYNANKVQLENSRVVPYFLDNFSTVKEALVGLDDIQLQLFTHDGSQLKGHYSLQDRSGDSAILEFIDGKWQIYHGEQYNVLTNSPEFSEHLNNWDAKKPTQQSQFSSQYPLDGNVGPAERFVWNKYMLAQLQEPSSIINGLAKIDSSTYKVPLDAANRITDGKMTGYATQYTLTYNLEQKELNMRYQYGDVYTQFKVNFNKLNDGKNYTLKVDEQTNIGDVTNQFEQKNGVMAQYRVN